MSTLLQGLDFLKMLWDVTLRKKYIHIYIYRERDREGEGEKTASAATAVKFYVTAGEKSASWF